MISIRETMERKIYLIKHGFTLVEVIAAIAILSIIFISISSFILLNVNLEVKNNSNTKKLAFIKSSIEILNSKQDKAVFKKYDNKNIFFFFDDLNELKNNINNDKSKNLSHIGFKLAKENNKDNKKYAIALNVEAITSLKETHDKDVNIFLVKSQIWDLSCEVDDSIVKEMYISR